MDLGLKHKKALVLGASKGLGLGIAKALLQEGADVAIVSRSHNILCSLAQTLSQQYQANVIPIVADLMNTQAENIIQEAVQKHFGHVDILINNVGGPPRLAIEDIGIEQWQRYFEVMFLRLVSLTTFFLPPMVRQQWGRVLTIASSGIIEPIQSIALSNVIRSALATWNKTMATEMAPYGVTINTIVPGKIETDRSQTLRMALAKETGQSFETITAQASQQIPMQRFGTVNEFADVAAFLVSTKASYVTGSLIRVDGGLIKSL